METEARSLEATASMVNGSRQLEPALFPPPFYDLEVMKQSKVKYRNTCFRLLNDFGPDLGESVVKRGGSRRRSRLGHKTCHASGKGFYDFHDQLVRFGRVAASARIWVVYGDQGVESGGDEMEI